MKKWTSFMLARSGIIAALYVALSFVSFPISSGIFQFRIAEALTILPLFYVEAVPALFIGCILSNLITACALPDIFFGALITLLAGVCTLLVGKLVKIDWLRLGLGSAFPVLLNALLLPVVWYFSYGTPLESYLVTMGGLLISQGLAVWGIGGVVFALLSK